MAGKFEVLQGPDGKVRFGVQAGNGEVVATGAHSALLRSSDRYRSLLAERAGEAV